MNGHTKPVLIAAISLIIAGLGWFLVDLHNRDGYLLRLSHENATAISELRRADEITAGRFAQLNLEITRLRDIMNNWILEKRNDD